MLWTVHVLGDVYRIGGRPFLIGSPWRGGNPFEKGSPGGERTRLRDGAGGVVGVKLDEGVSHVFETGLRGVYKEYIRNGDIIELHEISQYTLGGVQT